MELPQKKCAIRNRSYEAPHRQVHAASRTQSGCYETDALYLFEALSAHTPLHMSM